MCMDYVFVLVMQLCSVLYGCQVQGTLPQAYETRYECSINGYDKAKELHMSMHQSLPEPEKIGVYVKFWCDKIPKSDI